MNKKRFTKLIGLLLGVYLLVMLGVTVAESYRQPTLSTDLIFNLVNEERTKNGLNTLVRDQELNISSLAKCQDMLHDNYFDHQDENGDTWSTIKALKPEYKVAGENLGVTDETETQLVASWVNSPSHYEVMMSPEYNISGISVCSDEDYTYNGHTGLVLIVQHFTD